MTDRDAARVLAGVDAARRVGWARAYDQLDVSALAVATLAVAGKLLDEGDPAGARAIMSGALSRIAELPGGRRAMRGAAEALGGLADWFGEAPDQKEG